MRLKIVVLLVALPIIGGCHGLDRLLGNTSDDSRKDPQAPDANAAPLYNQATATAAKDDALIARLLPEASDPVRWSSYIQTFRVIQSLNGELWPGAEGRGFGSLTIDAWKAAGRRGLFDVVLLHDPNILHSNVYPVPVFQVTPEDLNLPDLAWLRD